MLTSISRLFLQDSWDQRSGPLHVLWELSAEGRKPRLRLQRQDKMASKGAAQRKPLQAEKHSYAYSAGPESGYIVEVSEEDLTLSPNNDPRVSTYTYDKRSSLVRKVDPLTRELTDTRCRSDT